MQSQTTVLNFLESNFLKSYNSHGFPACCKRIRSVFTTLKIRFKKKNWFSRGCEGLQVRFAEWLWHTEWSLIAQSISYSVIVLLNIAFKSFMHELYLANAELAHICGEIDQETYFKACDGTWMVSGDSIVLWQLLGRLSNHSDGQKVLCYKSIHLTRCAALIDRIFTEINWKW